MQPLHVHRYVLLWSDDHAEIDEHDPVRHTAFALMACQKCRRVEPFPVENYRLTTARYRVALNAKLTELGWRLCGHGTDAEC